VTNPGADVVADGDQGTGSGRGRLQLLPLATAGVAAVLVVGVVAGNAWFGRVADERARTVAGQVRAAIDDAGHDTVTDEWVPAVEAAWTEEGRPEPELVPGLDAELTGYVVDRGRVTLLWRTEAAWVPRCITAVSAEGQVRVAVERDAACTSPGLDPADPID
jgi:hypothetical protein